MNCSIRLARELTDRRFPRGMTCLRQFLLFLLLFPASLIGQTEAEVSIFPARFVKGNTAEVEYRFDVKAGLARALAVYFSWSVDRAVVKSVEKNGSALWLLNEKTEAPRESVITWYFDADSRRIVLQAYDGEFRSNDRIVVKLLVQASQLAGTDTLSGYVGGSLSQLRRCAGNPIMEVVP